MKKIGRAFGAELVRLALYALAFGAVFAALGLAYAEIGVFPIRSSVASALFLGGGGIIVIYGVSGGGARGRIADTERSGVRAVVGQPMPFTPILAGLVVIGIGVLTLTI